MGTVQHCLSAVKRVWSFTECILVTLNGNDDDDEVSYYVTINIIQEGKKHL